jgi:hypothetical protein
VERFAARRFDTGCFDAEHFAVERFAGYFEEQNSASVHVAAPLADQLLAVLAQGVPIRSHRPSQSYYQHVEEEHVAAPAPSDQKHVGPGAEPEGPVLEHVVEQWGQTE